MISLMIKRRQQRGSPWWRTKAWRAKITSTTKGAKLTKVGHTTSGKHGTGIHNKANHSVREVNPKG